MTDNFYRPSRVGEKVRVVFEVTVEPHGQWKGQDHDGFFASGRWYYYDDKNIVEISKVKPPLPTAADSIVKAFTEGVMRTFVKSTARYWVCVENRANIDPDKLSNFDYTIKYDAGGGNG